MGRFKLGSLWGSFFIQGCRTFFGDLRKGPYFREHPIKYPSRNPIETLIDPCKEPEKDLYSGNAHQP